MERDECVRLLTTTHGDASEEEDAQFSSQRGVSLWSFRPRVQSGPSACLGVRAQTNKQWESWGPSITRTGVPLWQLPPALCLKVLWLDYSPPLSPPPFPPSFRLLKSHNNPLHWGLGAWWLFIYSVYYIVSCSSVPCNHGWGGKSQNLMRPYCFSTVTALRLIFFLDAQRPPSERRTGGGSWRLNLDSCSVISHLEPDA